jgi:predicted DNA-binding transcriptional regulator AlpA
MRDNENELPPRLAAKWVLLPEALEETGMSRTSFYRYRADGVFGCRLWMNRLLVSRADIDRWLKHLESV